MTSMTSTINITTWQPGDRLPGVRATAARGALIDLEPDGRGCLDSSCWHHTGPRGYPPHAYRWTPGDPIPPWGATRRPGQPVTTTTATPEHDHSGDPAPARR